MFIFPADFFKIRDITLTVPLGGCSRAREQHADLLGSEHLPPQPRDADIDPKCGNDGFNAAVRYISEHPAPAVF